MLNGMRFVNVFNPKSVPEQAQLYSPEGKLAIRIIMNHFKNLMKSKQKYEIFLNWLAWQIQKPGKKIPWAPIIQSIEGMGKSFIGDLLRECLGYMNVGTIYTQNLNSDFNAFAHNKLVNVLEDIVIEGSRKERVQIMNKITPLITNTMVTVTPKGVDSYEVPNTINYIAFTNRKDAIMLNEHDRRWWVVFVPYRDKEHFAEEIGVSLTDYFAVLYGALEHSAEIHKWLFEYEISEEFKKTIRAPDSEEKLAVIKLEESKQQGLDETRELVEAGDIYYNQEVVCSGDLFKSLSFAHIDLNLSNYQKNKILLALGFSPREKRLRIDGEVRYIWTRRPMSEDEIKEFVGAERYNEKGEK